MSKSWSIVGMFDLNYCYDYKFHENENLLSFFIINLISVHCLSELSRISRIILSDNVIARHLCLVLDMMWTVSAMYNILAVF